MQRAIGRTLLCVISCALLAATSGAAAAAILTRLGGVPATSTDGISADGTVVVGTVAPGFIAFRFADGVLETLGPIPMDVERSKALSVSADGLFVVGVLNPAPLSIQPPRGFAWTPGGLETLADLPGGEEAGHARDVSYDAKRIVGWGTTDVGREAATWTESGVVGLGGLPGELVYSDAWSVNADGSVIVGVSAVATEEDPIGPPDFCDSGDGPASGLETEAFRWVQGEGGEGGEGAGTKEGLGHLIGGGDYSSALGVSADGSIVVGESDSSNGRCEAFLWRSGVMTGLGHLPGGRYSSAYAVSANGSVVVGTSDDETNEPHAFIWDADNGMRRLQQVLVDDYELPLADWFAIRAARGVSDDGRSLTAFGQNESLFADFEGILVQELPAPRTSLLQATAIGVVCAVARRRRRRRPDQA